MHAHLLDGTCATYADITDKASRLLVLFLGGAIEPALKYRSRAMVVFGSDKYVDVELGNLLLPAVGDLILRRHSGGQGELVEERKRKISEVDNFDLDIAVQFCDL